MTTNFKHTFISKIFFLLSILTLIFILIGKYANIYAYPITGAIFEIFWLPFVVCGIVGLVLSLANWIKQKFIVKSFYLYAIIIFLVSYFFIIIH